MKDFFVGVVSCLIIVLILTSCSMFNDLNEQDIFIGTYSETLFVREVAGDTLFFIREESYTSIETYQIGEVEAQEWADKFGYVIEW